MKWSEEDKQAARDINTAKVANQKAAQRVSHLKQLADRKVRVDAVEAKAQAHRDMVARFNRDIPVRLAAAKAKDAVKASLEANKREAALSSFNSNPKGWVADAYIARNRFAPSRKYDNLEQLVRDQYGLPRVTWSIKLITGLVAFEALQPENRRGARIALRNMIQSPEVVALRLAIDGKPQSLFTGGACPWMGFIVDDED